MLALNGHPARRWEPQRLRLRVFTDALRSGTDPAFLSVLLRASRIGELTRDEVAEIIQAAWLSRASARRAAAGLDAHPST